MRVKLTDELIAFGLRCPPGRKRCEFVDKSDAIGLYIEVRASRDGYGVYRYRYRSPATNKTRHARIGGTDEVTLEEARQKAKAMREQVALGIDPQDDIPAAQKNENRVPLLKEFFTQQYLPYAKTRKRGWKKDEQIFNYRLKEEFGNLKLDDITRQHAQAYLTQLIEDEKLAPATANHHVKLLRQVLNVALDWDLIGKNVVGKVRMLPVSNKIEHYMNEEQLGKLLEVLATYPARNACNVALFLLSTGARLNEALSATWVNIDREHRVWRIPAADSKSKKVRSVPLNDAALDVLDQLGSEGKHEYLFVKKDGERFQHLHQVWSRIRKKAGMPWLRLHDLRHQYASMLVNSGRTLYEVQAILGHADPQITTRYAHLSTAALQDAASQASKAISGARERTN